MVLNLTVGQYVRNFIFFFYKQKNGEFPIFRTFLGEKLNFGLYFIVNR